MLSQTDDDSRVLGTPGIRRRGATKQEQRQLEVHAHLYGKLDNAVEPASVARGFKFGSDCEST